MKHSDFQAWVNKRKADGMAEYQLATMLGCAPNSVVRWKRIDPPPYIGLAIAALEAGLKPWQSGR